MEIEIVSALLKFKSSELTELGVACFIFLNVFIILYFSKVASEVVLDNAHLKHNSISEPGYGFLFFDESDRHHKHYIGWPYDFQIF